MNGDGEVTAVHYLSWVDVEAAGLALADELAISGLIGSSTTLVAIARGGLVPATILAHRLGIATVESVPARITVDDTVEAAKSARPVVGPVPVSVHGAAVVLVDDVLGSGGTVQAVADKLATAGAQVRAVAVLVRNVAREALLLPVPTVVGRTIQGWVVFPWEVHGGTPADISTKSRSVQPGQVRQGLCGPE